MRFRQPDSTDPNEWLQAERAYRDYLKGLHLPDAVREYLNDPGTWEHGSVKCPHDFYLHRFTIVDPRSSSNLDRIICELDLICSKRKATMSFSYEGVRWADVVTSLGKWHEKLPQAIADEVSCDGEEIIHEWYLHCQNSIKIRCRSFSRTVTATG